MSVPVPIDLSLPEVLFTEPSTVISGGVDIAILDRLNELIDAAVNGSDIYFCFYNFSDPINQTTAKKLLKAAVDRGINVWVMIGANEKAKVSNASMIKFFEKNKHSKLKFIKSKPKRKGAIMHCKFCLFSNIQSKAGTIANIIFETSSNLRAKEDENYLGDGAKLQDAVIFQSAYMLKDGFKKYFSKIEEDNFEYFDCKTHIDNDLGKYYVKSYFFPKMEGFDPVIKAIELIGKNSTLRIACGKWHSPQGLDRSKAIVKALKVFLNEETNTLELIFPTKSDRRICNNLAGLSTLKGKVNIKMTRANLHSKYMMIEGQYNGVANRYIVFSGSHNFTIDALKENAEHWTKFQTDSLSSLYTSYLENFNKIMSLSFELNCNLSTDPDLGSS